MKNLVLFIAAAACTLSAAAQDFSSVLNSIEQNNATLRALRSKAEADVLEARTGLTPDDPDLDLAYLWETADPEGGHRVNVELRQSFDFPSVYYWRKKLSDGMCGVAGLEYAIGRKEVLLEARRHCIDLVYLNAVCSALAECVENATKIMKDMETRYACGDAGLVELNEAKIAFLNISTNYEKRRIERKETLEELARLNGGLEISHDISSFSIPFLPADFSEWYERASASSSELQLSGKDVEMSENSVRLAQSEWLPKFSIGYVSEMVPGSTLQGIGGGISIPLWANKGKVKAARARQKASADRLESEKASYFSEMKARYDKLSSLSALCSEYRSVLEDSETSGFLLKSVTDGEISFTQYVYSMQLWYDSLIELLESERDCHILLAELENFAQ